MITPRFIFMFKTTLALILSLLSTTIFARDYYVSTSGKDSNSGTLASPVKTISRAAYLAAAGDNVIIRAGTYPERVVPRLSGKLGAYIVYAAYPNEKVIINGTNVAVPNWGGLFDVSGKSYIKIQNISVVNSKSSGIFGHQMNNILVSNCITWNTVSSGIGMHYGNNIVITANDVGLANTTGEQENISVESVVNFEISKNHVHDGGNSSVGGEGIDAKGESHNGKIFGNKVHGIKRQGIYVDSYSSWLTNVSVYNNLVYSNARAGILIGNEANGYLESVYVYNNVVYNNEWVGIGVDKGAMQNVYIMANTVAKNGWTVWGMGIQTDNKQISNLVIINNTLSQNTGMQIRIDPSVSMSNLNIQYNLIDNSNRGWRLQGNGDTLGRNAINASPKFVDFNNNNFNLTATSAAISKGLNNATLPKFDFNYTPRPNGHGIDIGAFQYR